MDGICRAGLHQLFHHPKKRTPVRGVRFAGEPKFTAEFLFAAIALIVWR
jgi:hypothetical protein